LRALGGKKSADSWRQAAISSIASTGNDNSSVSSRSCNSIAACSSTIFQNSFTLRLLGNCPVCRAGSKVDLSDNGLFDCGFSGVVWAMVIFVPLADTVSPRCDFLDPATLKPGDKIHTEMNIDEDATDEVGGKGGARVRYARLGVLLGDELDGTEGCVPFLEGETIEYCWEIIVDGFHRIGDNKIRDTHCDDCTRTNSEAKKTDREGVLNAKADANPFDCEETDGERESLHLYKRIPSA
jgi:hypothetical protein